MENRCNVIEKEVVWLKIYKDWKISNLNVCGVLNGIKMKIDYTFSTLLLTAVVMVVSVEGIKKKMYGKKEEKEEDVEEEEE